PPSAPARSSRPKLPPAAAARAVAWVAAITGATATGAAASAASWRSDPAAGVGCSVSAGSTSATNGPPSTVLGTSKSPGLVARGRGLVDLQNARTLAHVSAASSDQRDEARRTAGCILHLRQSHDQHGAGRRHLVEISDVFQPPAARRQPRVVNFEVLRRTVIERQRVDGQAHDLALLHQPFGRLRADAGEVEDAGAIFAREFGRV